MARLGNQVILSGFNRTLNVALHRGHVVDRFSHHAGEFLHAGVAVKFQWVEGFFGFFGLLNAGLHLRFSLHIELAQLLPHFLQVTCEI